MSASRIDTPDAPQWAVTGLAHRPLRGEDACPACLALAQQAVAQARVAGSDSATHTEGPRGAEHSATVSRVFALHTPGVDQTTPIAI